MVRLIHLTIVVAVALCGFATAADWPEFRGPNGDGTADATNLPVHWGGFEPPTWQTEIPGRGWSSPIVVGDRIADYRRANRSPDPSPRKKTRSQHLPRLSRSTAGPFFGHLLRRRARGCHRRNPPHH